MRLVTEISVLAHAWSVSWSGEVLTDPIKIHTPTDPSHTASQNFNKSFKQLGRVYNSISSMGMGGGRGKHLFCPSLSVLFSHSLLENLKCERPIYSMTVLFDLHYYSYQCISYKMK